MWVTPGDNNKGIYVTLHNFEDETYNLTHPTAKLGGILKGSLNITVADTCYVTCPKSRLKAILTYQEEGWLGKTQNRMAGVIFRYDPDNDKTTTIKDVPSADILARVEGCWHEQIYFTLGSKAFEKSVSPCSHCLTRAPTDTILRSGRITSLYKPSLTLYRISLSSSTSVRSSPFPKSYLQWNYNSPTSPRDTGPTSPTRSSTNSGTKRRPRNSRSRIDNGRKRKTETRGMWRGSQGSSQGALRRWGSRSSARRGGTR